MYTCPICGKENPYYLCKGCGFDISCDYEHYPTLTNLNKVKPAISKYRKDYEDKLKKYLSCKNCGGRTFYVDSQTKDLICACCLTPVKEQEKEDAFTGFSLTDAIEYADNLIENTDYDNGEDLRNAAKKLKLLYEKFKESEDIATYYCHVLSVLSLFQDSKNMRETVSEISLLHNKFSDNEIDRKTHV